MAPDRWNEIRTLFDEVVSLEPAARAEKVTAIEATDPELGRRLRELLDSDARASSVLARFEPLMPIPESRSFDPKDLTGRYTVEREIGSGGMATVYLAQDLRHNRKVALKVLRPELAATIGPQRFLQEIEIAARLQHPNILPLLDSGEAGGFLYYVMPFVEGKTLRDRLRREGELPVDVAVRILMEVVDALAEAHRHRLIHRDIKPENVLLTGRHAVVADFGIAKAVEEAAGRHGVTTAGVALGTPAYMAPEQASGESQLDHRVDIYSVGAMAYEMLTGQPPFTGSSSAQVLVKQVTETPVPVGQLRPTVSPQLEAIVMKCLAKHPADRWQSAEELLAQLEPILTTPSGGVTPTDTRPVPEVKVPGWRRMLVLGAVAGIVLLALATALWRGGRERGIEWGPVRPVTSEPGLERHPSLSPDGKTLAYAAGGPGRLRVMVRSLAGGTPIEVAKDYAGNQLWPRWSPDGTRLLFRADDGIRIVPSLGGSSRVLVEGARAGIWSPDGKEVAYELRDTLFVRPVEGGKARPVVSAGALHSPSWSPDGKLIAFVSGNRVFNFGGSGDLAPSVLMAVPASGGTPVQLTSRRFLSTSPQWLDNRYLVFMSSMNGGRDLHLLTLDASGRAQGAPTRLTTGLDIEGVSVSADGRQVAYSTFPNTRNVWSIPIPASGVFSDADAKQVTTGTQHIEGVAVSRDGKWLAFDSDRQGSPNIYVMPLDGSAPPTQITNDPSIDFYPAWSPDGKEIAFTSWRNESRDMYVVPAAGGEEKLVAGGPDMEMYADWSADGQSLVFQSSRTSPGGLWIATRDRDGSWRARQFTRDGGYLARWSPDGKRILYLSGAEDCLCTIERDGTGRKVLLRRSDPRFPFQNPAVIWSPDASTIYLKALLADGRMSYWALPATGGKPRLLVRFDDPMFRGGHPWFGTDGKRLYFAVADRPQGDIKVMELRWRK